MVFLREPDFHQIFQKECLEDKKFALQLLLTGSFLVDNDGSVPAFTPSINFFWRLQQTKSFSSIA